MIILSSTSHLIRAVTSSANALDVTVGYVDGTTTTYVPAAQVTAIASATTTTVLSAPAASTQRQLKYLTANARGGANTVTVQFFDGATAYQIVSPALLTGEAIQYEDSIGWQVLDANGQFKQTITASLTLTGDVTGTGSGTVPTTLATVNANVGTFGSATQVAQVTANAKGLVTAVSNVAIAIAAGSVSGLAAIATSGSATDLTAGTLPAGRFPALTGDITTSAGALATTLATVNANVGTFGDGVTSQIGKVTVNAKGLVTAASQTAISLVNDTPVLGDLLFTAIAAPSTPAAGKGSVYIDSTSKNLAVKNDAGVVNHGIQTRTATGSNWIRAIADDGSSTISQPAFTDISGTANLTTQASGTLQAAQFPALTGPVTTSAGSLATSVTANAITNTMLAQAPALTVKGNATTATANETDITMAALGGLIDPPPLQLQALELWGHSYLDDPLTGTAITSLATNDNNNFGYIYAAAMGIPRANVRNHAVSGSQLTALGYGGVNGAGGNFAKMLVELTDARLLTLPFTRSGGAHLVCYGINDIGGNTSANQALLRSTAQDILTYVVSRMRAAAFYSAQGATNQAFGANWTNAATTAIDWTSGLAKVCSTVDSAGTSTVTFTIPFGYKGEPICFGISSQSSATSMQITWGGTVTGTSGIVGTVSTLSSRSLNTNGIVGFRWTNATNGLSAANAGQTITFKLSAVTAQSCWYDGVVIEARKPAPVLLCNQGRLPQRNIAVAAGDGVTTGVNTSFTSAIANFSTTGGWQDFAGAVITETDAQGAFTGSANTVGSVTNATTIALGSNAAAAKTSIQYTRQVRIAGYSSTLYWNTNTNFTGATVASHSAADTDITNWNSMISTVAGLFDSMVQVVDLDAATGSDTNCPASAYSLWSTDGGHPNNLGAQYWAKAVWTAASALSRPASDDQDIGVMQVQSSPSYIYAPQRRIRFSGKQYVGDYSSIVAGTNLAANNFWAYPVMVTEPTEFWGALQVQTTTAPVGTTTLRAAWYDDPNCVGYPQAMRVEATAGGAVTVSTTAAPQLIALGSIGRPVHTGLNWLVLKVDAVGATPGVLLTVGGPCAFMPSWTGATGMTAGPVAWLATGTAGAMPSKFPSGATLASTAPLLAVTVTVQ